MGEIVFLFWNKQQRRLRAGWRLVVQVLLLLATLVGLAVVADLLAQGLGTTVLVTVLYLALGLGAAWLLARLIDRRPLADYGFHLSRTWWLDLGFGFALGAALMTGICLAECLAGWLTLTVCQETESGPAPFLAFLASLGFYAVVAANEEFAFRGYQLRNLAEGLAGRRLGERTALVLAWLTSSALFGVAHLTNEHTTALSTLNIVLFGGLMALPYLATGELSIPIGLHWSWNLFQGTVYGLAVSGSVPTRRLLAPQQAGPDVWTGGSFGPEGGLLASVSVVVGCALTVLWIRGRNGRLGLDASLAHYRGRPQPGPSPATGAMAAGQPD
jgi:membrane protease YdiL (CAAX protease family)